MSINHFSSDSPETLWWAQQHHLNMEPSTKSTSSPKPGTSSSFICHQPNATAAAFWANSQICHHPIVANQNSALNFDLNNEDEEETIEEQPPGERENQNLILNEQDDEIPKEPLFEKPLTPSDVGKLNRLVIPKQHAEKYFPLSGNDSGEKGLLLSFEDESGKPWTFRYSYWNSSQSYVLTKGWSRFVKEKRLDAGDIVLFGRHRLDGDRLFVGWRRRSTAAATSGQESGAAQPVALSGGGGGGGGWGRVYFSGHPYPSGHSAAHGHGPALPYQPDCLHAAAAASVLQNQTTQTSANSKRLRLFGVNLECQQQPDESGSESEPPTLPDQGSSTWSQGQAQYQFQHYPKVHHAYFNHHNHMDINFSRDVNQTRYRQG